MGHRLLCLEPGAGGGREGVGVEEAAEEQRREGQALGELSGSPWAVPTTEPV